MNEIKKDISHRCVPPVASGTARVLQLDTEIGGYLIPKGVSSIQLENYSGIIYICGGHFPWILGSFAHSWECFSVASVFNFSKKTNTFQFVFVKDVISWGGGRWVDGIPSNTNKNLNDSTVFNFRNGTDNYILHRMIFTHCDCNNIF